ncbi:MAG: FAD-dependent thymidylate synthase, partial [Deltaproteobacteria bacterium]|nr:FAD-dependent thymidylate synthase [Deltaproteobacteria bacterium]
VDYGAISDFQDGRGDRERLTPETIAAAYARISREQRPVNELRALAMREVEKARKSNRNIVFTMGHSSIAEHAVLNIDVVGVSRLLVEEMERSRLASYTEKSQRYVLLEDDFVIPQEIREAGLETVFVDAVGEQNRLYHKLYACLRTYVFEKHHNLAADRNNNSLLEGWAKEDARYIIALATQTQLGMTINARSLEAMIRRLAASPLSEARECARRLYEVAVSIAPSLVRYVEPTDYERLTGRELGEKTERLVAREKSGAEKERISCDRVEGEVALIHATPDADDRVVAALLYSSADLSGRECREIVAKMDAKDKAEVIKTVCRHMHSYDSVRREFENVDLQFELTVSASCFAQLKRHRMATINCQGYNPSLGVTIPEAVLVAGMEKDFRGVVERTEAVYEKLKKSAPTAAAYILTNAHRRRVAMKINARELYHIARLRGDQYAQWDIRQTADKMTALAKEVMPLTLMLATGKDDFKRLYDNIFQSAQ